MIAEAIHALLRDPLRRQQLTIAGRRWAERHLDVERSLDHYAALYHDLAERVAHA